MNFKGDPKRLIVMDEESNVFPQPLRAAALGYFSRCTYEISLILKWNMRMILRNFASN
jgi:hypothetical protein